MTPEFERRVEEVFHAALERPPAERASFVTEACAGEATLQARVEQLLARDAQASEEQFLETPTSLPSASGAEREEPDAALTGRQIGAYEVEGFVAGGGMGVVYKARHTQLRRTVALKLLRYGLFAEPAEQARFRTEAEAVARFSHPNIVPIYEVGEHEGLPYFAMEYLEGGSLAQKLAAAPLPPRQAAELVETLARAMHYAHAQKVIHRDLKPANVLFAADGTPKLSDFGLAKRLDADQDQTQTGAIVGTPPYMAPEQARGERKAVGPAADVYALGALLYAVLTGRPPFQAPTQMDTLVQVIADEPVSPRRLQPKVPRDLETICLKCLEKEPRRRYVTAEAVANDLRCLLDGKPVKARPVGQIDRLLKWVRRHPAKAAAYGLLVLVLVLGLGGSGVVCLWQEAVAARYDADKQRVEADKHRAGAEKQRDQAARARDRTFQALDMMTSSTTGESLETQQAITTEQKKFLTEVLTYYQELTGDQGEDEGTKKQIAAAAHRIGLICTRLGNHEVGIQALEKACDSYEQLAADFSSMPEYRQRLAKSRYNLSKLYLSVGRWKAAEQECRAALGIQRKLTAEFPSMADNWRDLARSQDSLGLLLGLAGQPKAAETEHHAALVVRKQLAGDFPSVADYWRELAISHNNIGALLRPIDRPAAVEEYRAALAIRKQLTTDFPAVPDYREDLARSHNNLGLLLKDAGQLEAAEAEHRAALTIRKQLAADFPSVPRYRYELAGDHYNLGALLQTADRAEEAEDQFRAARRTQEKVFSVPMATVQRPSRAKEAEEQYWVALALLEQLVAHFPSRPEFRRDLAASHNSLGSLLYRTGRLKEAEAAYGAALDLYKQLAADFPNQPDLRTGLATTCGNLALLCNQRREFQWARAYLDEARSHHQAALKANPQHPTYRQVYRNNLAILAHASAGLLDRAGAVHAAETIRDLGWEPPGDAYDAACALAGCIPIVEEHEQLDAEKRQAAVQFYGDQALALLRDAVAQGFQDAARLKKEEAFAPLRPRADFQKLLAELEGKQAATAEPSPRPPK